MSGLTFRIVGATLFGSDFAGREQEVAELVELANLQTLEIRSLLTLWPWIPTPHNRRWGRARRRLDHFVGGMIEGRQRGGAGDEDLLDRLICARDEEDGQEMAAKQVRDEVVTLMLAGHETSATALAWTLYLLGRHPDIEARLVESLRTELNGAPANACDLSRLPYLKQVVQESMRIYPPVWLYSRRSVYEEEFNGYTLPANAYVAITPYVLHRHPEFWPDPERFDPDRFGPERDGSRHPYCYLPFAAGPRACIGSGMAMLEIQLVLAQILQRFRVHVVPDHLVETTAKVTLKPLRGILATLSRR